MTSIPLGATAAGAAVALDCAMANRHGLIAGATGTGKTVTLQTLAEGFSRAGVPVFLADVKGDLAGIAQGMQMAPEAQSWPGLNEYDGDAIVAGGGAKGVQHLRHPRRPAFGQQPDLGEDAHRRRGRHAFAAAPRRAEAARRA